MLSRGAATVGPKATWDPMLSLFKRKPSQLVARRLVALAVAHGLREQEIPRLFAGIGYAQLDDLQSLARAITPAVVDSAAELFGVRREFVEGLDELVYLPLGSGRASAKESTQVLVDATARAVAATRHPSSLDRGPLAVLTADSAPDRLSGRRQRVVPVIIEPSGAEVDGPVYRCRVFGGYFDWNDSEQRIGLKALAWLVWRRLRKVVPLYQVSERDLVGVLNWIAVPSAVFTRSLVTDPSLEDYIEAPRSSAVARESDELPEVLAFLESSGLVARWDAAFAQESPAADASASAAETLLQSPEAPAPARPPGGKREASEATKEALRVAARVIWTAEPEATKQSVVERLKAMPHLKGSAWSDSAIRKAISSVAPPGSDKPGRRPKKSP